jgi:hypothetical protein
MRGLHGIVDTAVVEVVAAEMVVEVAREVND